VNAFGRLAALSGAVAVVAGAFGAHALAGDPAQWMKTGGEYQLIHAVAAFAARRFPLASTFLLFGSWLFAGSLYGLALGGGHWLGPITPIGGGLMILGWGALALSNREERYER